MSLVKIQGDPSGTGTLTIAAPNTSSNYTLTLPTATGTVQVSGNPISGTTGSFSGDLSFNSGYGSAAVGYGCRAWVNFNGTGTVGIRASGNVSSITDGGVGTYTVNFTTAMPDANYSYVGTAGRTGATGTTIVDGSTTVPTTSAFDVQTRLNSDNTTVDAAYVYVAIFR